MIVGVLVLIASIVDYIDSKKTKSKVDAKNEYNNNNNNNICIESNKDLSTCDSEKSLKSQVKEKNKSMYHTILLTVIYICTFQI